MNNIIFPKAWNSTQIVQWMNDHFGDGWVYRCNWKHEKAGNWKQDGIGMDYRWVFQT